MKAARIVQIVVLQLFGIAALFLSGCDELKPGASSVACASNGTAQIQIFDAGMERVCGCAEAANTSVGTSGGLQCTVPSGTTLTFYYPGIQNSHQVAIPYYGSGWAGQVRSASTSLNQSDSLLLNSTGTFTFRDNYTGIAGTLIVQ